MRIERVADAKQISAHHLMSIELSTRLIARLIGVQRSSASIQANEAHKL